MSRLNTARIPGPPVPGSDPLMGDFPRYTTAKALAESLPPGSTVDPAVQLAATVRTAWADHTLDGPRVLARPARGVGFVHEMTVASLRTWAQAALPAWRQLDDAGYARVVALTATWLRERDAAQTAALPADQRRADEIAAQRRAAERRAELEGQQADAARELAEMDAGHVPTEQPPARGGWLRRTAL